MLIVGVALFATLTLILINRRWFLFALLAVFTLFPELGEGFTSNNGSIFFNAKMLGFARLKLIEIIILTAGPIIYTQNWLQHSHRKHSTVFRLMGVWLLWVAILLLLEYRILGSFPFQQYRGIYTGLVLVYVFENTISNRAQLSETVRWLLFAVIAKSVYLILMYIAGYGDYSNRGYSPLIWDDKFLKFTVWTFLILAGAGISYRKVLFSKAQVAIGLIFTSVLLLLSLRRNYLVHIFASLPFLLQKLNINIIRITAMLLFLSILFFGTIGGLYLFGSADVRNKIISYSQLLMPTSEAALTHPSNLVHFDNVISYTTMIAENPTLLLVGANATHAPDGDLQFFQQYQSDLGVAHNGPLRATYKFGIPGLLIWLSFFYFALRNYRSTRRRDFSPFEFVVVVASLAYMAGEFLVTLTFIPPFFTTYKGIFFFLIVVYFLESYRKFVPELPVESAGREMTSEVYP